MKKIQQTNSAKFKALKEKAGKDPISLLESLDEAMIKDAMTKEALKCLHQFGRDCEIKRWIQEREIIG